jgi:phenylacetic acid degradation protein
MNIRAMLFDGVRGDSDKRASLRRVRWGEYGQVYEAEGQVPWVHRTALVHETAVLIGDVSVGAHCFIGPNAVLRGDQGSIVIERDSSVQDCCVLHTGPDGRIHVGESAQIGHGAVLHGATLGRDVVIGMRAVVMDDAVVEDGGMVAAASLVLLRFRVPAGMWAMGAPAKIVRQVKQADIDLHRRVVAHYVDIARRGVGARRVSPRIVEEAPGAVDAADERRNGPARVVEREVETAASGM